jgi:hypothetical protein
MSKLFLDNFFEKSRELALKEQERIRAYKKQKIAQEKNEQAQIEAKEIFLKNINQKFAEIEKKIPVVENLPPVSKKPNTLKYAGIGLGVLVLGYFGYKLIKK